MKAYLFIIFLFSCLFCKAQSNVVTTGGQSTGTTGSVNYTVGQIDYIAASSPSGTLTLGNQQPFEIITLETIDFNANVKLVLYPNPTYQNVNLIVVDYDNQKLNYSLSDMTGKVLFENQINKQTTLIPLENYSLAVYIIKVYSQDKKSSKSFKVIKK